MARPQTLESAPAEAPLYPPRIEPRSHLGVGQASKTSGTGAQRDCPESSKDSPDGQRVFSQSPCRELGLKASWSTAARSRCWQRPRALETSSRCTGELFANRSEAAISECPEKDSGGSLGRCEASGHWKGRVQNCIFHALPFVDKKRNDKIVGRQDRLGHHRPDRRRLA